MRLFLTCGFLALLMFGSGATTAPAEVVRYHYSPTVVSGYSSTSLKVGPNGSSGEWSPSLIGLRKEAYYQQPNATHMVTFRHPYTGQDITVPIAFPQGTPQVTYQPDTIVYNYTQYQIRVQFLRDGSVDVVYNSGIFRPFQL
jgi:hypothetical protein